MTVSVDLWQMAGIASAWLGVFASLMAASGKLMVGQFEKRLDDRFSTQKNALLLEHAHWEAKLEELAQATAAESRLLRELDAKMSRRFEEKTKHIGRLEVEIQRYPTRDVFEKERELSRVEIVRIHERMDELNKTAQQTQLLLGEVYGQLKQLNAHGNRHD